MNKLYCLLAIFVLSGCDGDTSYVSIEDNEWQLVSYGYEADEKTMVLAESGYQLSFTNGIDVTGTIDCNSFISTYSVNNFAIILEPFGTTEKLCPQSGIEAYESEISFVVDALNGVLNYTVSNGQLIIVSSDTSQLIYENNSF